MKDARINPAPTAASEEARAVEARILETRGEITGLYRILLNSPAVCAGWEQLLTAIRQKTGVPPRLRELIILRVAVLNGAPYEFTAHIPHARKAGISDAEMEAVKSGTISGFGDLEQRVLSYTDAMTRDVQVPDNLFLPIQAAFDAQGLVELTATIAAYNMVSRFLAALNVH
jgi:4-carboxymuconolactone decarboxylase